jgi:hypothetical protein
LLVIALAAVVSCSLAYAATGTGEDSTYTGSLGPSVAHDIRIEFVKSGREGFELSARLAEGGGTIERPVFWTVRHEDGEFIYRGEEPVADLATEPGDYVVTARYGTVTVERTIVLLPEQRLGVSFVLNVGGLRVLPRLPDLGLPSARSETRVYAVSGDASGKLVAMSTIPGEILRLGAGAYRIESRFMPGNATSTSTVDIAPGALEAVELDLVAGIVRLNASSTVTWTITKSSGETLPPIEGATTMVVLTPGDYRAEAMLDGRLRTATFSIAQGEIQDILLEN